ncbi:hypothetical protein HKD37_09G025514 [Glycine soja]
MPLALRFGKFVDSLCKRPPDIMDELGQRDKGYIQMEEMSRFRNEVRQAGQKRNKREAQTKADSHKSNKRHKPDKCQPLYKGPMYERYTPLTANRTMILKEAFNLETKPPRPRSDATKYCRYHCGIGHNTKDCWALKDKIEELIQAEYLAQFVKRPDSNQAGPRLEGH